MAIYVVTGKLGGGKTLGGVSRIDEALRQGRKVATNLDLTLVNLPSCRRSSKRARVLRVPDRPSEADIRAIGYGIEGVETQAQARKAYDESEFGALVLDECGTWLNSRDWQAEGRRELINFLLHIRKHLWDVYLIIQDISMLDKQARKALAEHVVYCRRTDRFAIPFIGTVWRWATGDQLKLPKLHVGHVKYGDQPNSMTVHKWWYRGERLFEAYDTTQVFTEDYPHGVHSVLPPWYLYSKSLVNWNWRKAVQLTKIYLRQYSRTLLLAAGVFAGATLANAFQSDTAAPVTESQPVADDSEAGSVFDLAGEAGRQFDNAVPLVHRLRIHSYSADRGRRRVIFTDGEIEYSEHALEAIGVLVRLVGRCEYRLDQGPDTAFVACFG